MRCLILFFKKGLGLFVLKMNYDGRDEEYVTYINYKKKSGNIIHVNFNNGYVKVFICISCYSYDIIQILISCSVDYYAIIYDLQVRNHVDSFIPLPIYS